MKNSGRSDLIKSRKYELQPFTHHPWTLEEAKNIVGKGKKKLLVTRFFVAFVEDNATMSSIRYFQNQVSYFVRPY